MAILGDRGSLVKGEDLRRAIVRDVRAAVTGDRPRRSSGSDGRAPATGDRPRRAIGNDHRSAIPQIPLMIPCNLTRSEFAHLMIRHMEELAVINTNIRRLDLENPWRLFCKFARSTLLLSRPCWYSNYAELFHSLLNNKTNSIFFIQYTYFEPTIILQQMDPAVMFQDVINVAWLIVYQWLPWQRSNTGSLLYILKNT